MTSPPDGPQSGPFVRAARGLPTSHVPVWFMRQAGRSLPEYRRLREGVAMLDACMRPDLVVEITLQPVRRYGVDAAILFSDIVLPLKAIGVDLDIVAGVGPVIASPVRDRAGVEAIPAMDPGRLAFVVEAVGALVDGLGSTPLIGFAGAPYTLASYLIEGGPSKDHARTKALMHSDQALWDALLAKLADISGAFLRLQIEAGASAVQLFDSWAGGLTPGDYRRYVLPHSTAVFGAVADLDVPRLHFGVATGELLGDMSRAGVEVMGVDWRVPLDDAVRRIQPGQAVQGNLDPALVFAPPDVIETAARDILARGRAAAGHIFNLGHGVLPDTDPDVLARLVDVIHSYPGAGEEPDVPQPSRGARARRGRPPGESPRPGRERPPGRL
ncbi:MAG: uroporphyrinogen decarboxylase [Nocardioidaceae bacterium]|nr:uroporphyrinogen decarboxylase [Nocardioidaceae bacterium]